MTAGNASKSEGYGGMDELRNTISELHKQLSELGTPPPSIAQVVDSTNILRTNEYLRARDALLSKLISSYGAYAKKLESLTSNVLDVQSGLLEVLKQQSSMIKEGRSDSAHVTKQTRQKKPVKSTGAPSVKKSTTGTGAKKRRSVKQTRAKPRQT